MKKKLLLFALMPLLMSSLTGCKKKADFNIGIIQFGPIPALTEATKGFKAQFKSMIGSKTVDFEFKNAQLDGSAASAIVNTFVSKQKDLIMANATPCVQAAANATATIPILGTSVTTYEGAFGGSIPSNVSGTSDLADLDAQAAMVFEWYPSATKIGVLYCTAEPNSLYQVNMIKTALNNLKSGLVITEVSFSDTNDLSLKLSAAAPNLDVLYIPTDNTCADNASSINTLCVSNHLPVIAGEAGICKDCGLATLSIDYYRLGQITGKMAYEVLVEHADISHMEIRYDETQTKYYNPAALADLGLTEADVPEGYLPLE